MLKATQQMERLEKGPRSAQASFRCAHQASFSHCPHTIQEWCSECGDGSGCGHVLLLLFPSV